MSKKHKRLRYQKNRPSRTREFYKLSNKTNQNGIGSVVVEIFMVPTFKTWFREKRVQRGKGGVFYFNKNLFTSPKYVL